MLKKISISYLVIAGVLFHIFILYGVIDHYQDRNNIPIETIHLPVKFHDSTLAHERLGYLSLLPQSGYSIKIDNFISLIGVPDLWTGDKAKGNIELAYFYDRFGKSDWVAYVGFENGQLQSIGWNDSTVNNHNNMQKW